MSYAISYAIEENGIIIDGIGLVPEEFSNEEAQKMIKEGFAHIINVDYEKKIREQINEIEQNENEQEET